MSWRFACSHHSFRRQPSGRAPRSCLKTLSTGHPRLDSSPTPGQLYRWPHALAVRHRERRFVEQSNIYTDASTVSSTATAVMLVNDAVAGATFTYKARLIAGDDDAFGLIFGYQNPTNFYRVTFTRQVRADAGFPWNGLECRSPSTMWPPRCLATAHPRTCPRSSTPSTCRSMSRLPLAPATF